jgi:hypothetical protein
MAKFEPISDAEFDRATKAGRREREVRPIAASARYDAVADRVVVKLSTGLEVAFSPRDAQGLTQASSVDLEDVRVTEGGFGLWFPAVDVDLSIPRLLEGFLGSKSWTARAARAAASRANGRLGGRPRKQATAAVPDTLALRDESAGQQPSLLGAISAQPPSPLTRADTSTWSVSSGVLGATTAATSGNSAVSHSGVTLHNLVEIAQLRGRHGVPVSNSEVIISVNGQDHPIRTSHGNFFSGLTKNLSGSATLYRHFHRSEPGEVQDGIVLAPGPFDQTLPTQSARGVGYSDRNTPTGQSGLLGDRLTKLHPHDVAA